MTNFGTAYYSLPEKLMFKFSEKLDDMKAKCKRNRLQYLNLAVNSLWLLLRSLITAQVTLLNLDFKN